MHAFTNHTITSLHFQSILDHHLPSISKIPLNLKAKRMAKLSSLISCFLLSIFLLLVTATSKLGCDNGTTNGVRGMIIFGDDIVDNGNNNGIVGSYIKSNYLPYGVDFPYGPSGRFSNGKTIADCVADNLKLPYYPPPYPDSSHQGVPLLKGVNFGSAGTGIFSITGSLIIVSFYASIRLLY